MTAVSSNDVTFEIYQKNYSSGETVLLGANGQSAYCVNYAVFVNAQAVEETTEPTTTEPTTEPITEESTTQTSVKEIVYGDADLSGNVDIIDVLVLNQYLIGIEELDENGQANADVNRDGNLADDDAMNILKSLVKLVTLPL